MGFDLPKEPGVAMPVYLQDNFFNNNNLKLKRGNK